jgi:hypothetical protein
MLFAQLLPAHLAFALWGTLLVMSIVLVLKQGSHTAIMLSYEKERTPSNVIICIVGMSDFLSFPFDLHRFFASVAQLVACIVAIRLQTSMTPRLSSIQAGMHSFTRESCTYAACDDNTHM